MKEQDARFLRQGVGEKTSSFASQGGERIALPVCLSAFAKGRNSGEQSDNSWS